MTEIDYKEAYEREKERCQDLADRLILAEFQRDELQSKLDFIHNSAFWKLSSPVRKVIHFFIRQAARVKRVIHPRDLIKKLKYKNREKKASQRFGTASFPDAQQRKRESEEVFDRTVTFSILVPLWNTPENFLREMIESVLNQTYAHFQLCLADGSDEEHTYVGRICQEYAEKADGRITYRHLEKNMGIAGNTNACYEMATGEYIGLFDHDDILHPSALYAYCKAINETGADFLYCDESTFENGSVNHLVNMHFKPDYAPDNLRANNYICHFSVFARTLLEGTELFRTSFDGSQDHDMILRLTDRAEKVVHIPRLLYYWRSHDASTAADIGSKPYAIEAAKKAVGEHLTKHGFSHFQISSTRAFPTIFRIRYQILGEPKISVLIPNKDHQADLKRLIDSILEKTLYPNYELLILENNSETAEIREYYEFLQKEHADRIRIIPYQGDFNYAAVNNFGAKEASGEYLLLLNNDTEVISVNWMEELLMYAQREDVGAVGCKLFYPDHTIQHAGIVIGLGAHGSAGHTHHKHSFRDLGYMGRLCYAQDVSAVTGACLMVKKSLYEQVGGLDEDFAVSLNDVDFCLKLREMGLLNIFTPFAELYHYESCSRGSDESGENKARYDREAEHFRQKWKAVLEKGDPYFNPNFTLTRSDYTLKLSDDER